MTPEAFSEWKNHPVTMEIFKELEKTREAKISDLANGLTLCTTAGETHGSTARMIGSIEGINQILNISFEDEGLTEGNE